MDRADNATVFCFGEFELDTHAGELRRAGTRIALQEQPLQVLRVLLQEAGKLVRREDLRQKVWPENTYVEFDDALNTAVKKIRIALGDCADAPQYIETIPKRGYRFITPVTSAHSTAGSGIESALWFPGWRNRRVWLAGTVAALLVICFSLLGMLWRSGAKGLEPKPLVVSVLPLQDLSEDSSGGPLGDGLGDELTMQLGRADPATLAVTSRAATLAYRHTNKTVAEVARDLRSAYLLEGNIRGNAHRVRVCMELIRTSDELQIWSDSFDRDREDVLAVETELSATISNRVKDALRAETTHGKARP